MIRENDTLICICDHCQDSFGHAVKKGLNQASKNDTALKCC